MIFLWFTPQITAGSLFIAGAVVALALALYRQSPVGAGTVELWQSRAEGLEAQLADTRENLHQAELDIKERETRIATLEARPDTQRVYDIVQQHHAENQAILTKVAQAVEKSTDIQGAAMAMLETLVERQHNGRSHDPPSPS